MPFMVDSIRLRTQMRAEMFTKLGFRNADTHHVRRGLLKRRWALLFLVQVGQLDKANGWLGTTVGVAHQLFRDTVCELVGAAPRV